MDQSPPYPDGTKGALLRAAFLPEFPFLWIMFLEDLSRHGEDGMRYLDKKAYENESPGACLQGAFYFRRSSRENMWCEIAFENTWSSDPFFAVFEKEIRDEFLAGRKKEEEEPSVKNGVHRTGLVSRKIHLPKK